MPKGPRKFYFTFEKSGLTRFGGLSLFQVFCRSLQIRRFLQVLVHWPDYDYRGYHPADLFLAHVFSIVAGLGRIENTQCLIHNGLVPPLLGLNDFPHRDTLRTFLLRFGPESLRNLQAGHDKLRSELFRRLGLLYSATVDADTTTLITYGSQEGVARGYIPKRRHTQPSYAPLLSSEGRSGLSLGMELGAGDVHSSSGLALLLRSRFSGTPAARIQGCLRHEQDPHPEVFGQRRLSGGDSVGLRLGAGFSEALSPSRTAPLERLHPPPRALVASGGMGQTRQSQPSALAGEISAARPFRPSPAGHGQSATADLTDFAKVPTCVLPKIQEI